MKLAAPDGSACLTTQAADCLGGPGSGGVGCDAGEVHSSGVCFDEEQDVEPAQGDSVDREQVGGD